MYKRITLLTILVTIMISMISTTVFAINENISAKSAILIERDSGRILYSKNISQKLPIASTTKIMTALIAIEKGDLNKVVTIKKEWTEIEGSSIYLKPNEKIKLKDLIFGLMLRSGNDAAVAIAHEIAGSVENFSVLMNKRAKEIGAKNTNFTNPHGLHSEDHYSTAYDLAIITREALKNEIFREISKTNDYVPDRKSPSHFYNKNKTLTQYKGGDGVKIGYTKLAGRCLVASATRDNMQLIAVVLDDNNWFENSYKLFDYGFENYKRTTIIRKDNFIEYLNIKNSNIQQLPIFIPQTFTYPLQEDELEEIDILINTKDSLIAPVEKGYVVSKIVIKLKNNTIYKSNIILNERLKEKSIFTKLNNKIEYFFSKDF
ncbi:D-alanyl-D-alanine carboxypeptidase family protein [Senegalia massiliensis]|uniref:D-alanyl-D-alanine carboxypeptidase family protein n=1 Tax=Senegalia massiliensis TaxID=1720316 RepID=UPI0010308944|nr:D-alanyl-D-alanine carboxypeptidase family protein [Senegalia massiliensis]